MRGAADRRGGLFVQDLALQVGVRALHHQPPDDAIQLTRAQGGQQLLLQPFAQFDPQIRMRGLQALHGQGRQQMGHHREHAHAHLARRAAGRRRQLGVGRVQLVEQQPRAADHHQAQRRRRHAVVRALEQRLPGQFLGLGQQLAQRRLAQVHGLGRAVHVQAAAQLVQQHQMADAQTRAQLLQGGNLRHGRSCAIRLSIDHEMQLSSYRAHGHTRACAGRLAASAADGDPLRRSHRQ